MAESEWFEGISYEIDEENVRTWTARLDHWQERFGTEWEAVAARDIRLLQTYGDTAQTNLSRPAVRDMIRRGGWDYVRTDAGANRAAGLVNTAKLRAEGPLPDIAPATYGKAMRKKRPPKLSRFHGVHQAAGDRWQAKLGRKYICSAPDERVAALMRDIASLEKTLAEMNYPLSFVREASLYGFKALQKAQTLALFINRLDEQLAIRDGVRTDAGSGASPVANPDPELDGSGTDGASDA